jgi:hypothetical protein
LVYPERATMRSMAQMAYSGGVGRLRTSNAPVCSQKAIVPDFGQFTKRGSDAPQKLLEKFGRGTAHFSRFFSTEAF